MPYPRFNPVDEKLMEGPDAAELADIADMNKHRYDGHHSICQTIREIYRMSDDPELKLKARVAMAMAKKMHIRLKQYKSMFDERKEP